MRKLKIFKADLLSAESGIKSISLVENPAFQSVFSCFSDAKSVRTQFEVIDEEKRIVFGPVLIPDKLILRNDKLDSGEELYAIVFDVPAIEKFRERFFEGNNFEIADHDHRYNVDGTRIEGMIVNESVVKRPGIEVHGYDDLPDGTWFIGFKVKNDDTWSKIKENQWKGFSPDVCYDLMETGETIEMTEFNQIKNMNSKKPQTKWGKFSSVRSLYQETTGHKLVYSSFGSVMTTSGDELLYDGELILEKTGVMAMKPDGTQVVADGEYIISEEGPRNGRSVVIDNGEVVEYEAPEAEETQLQDEVPTSTADLPADAQATIIENDAETLETLAETMTEKANELEEKVTNLIQTVESISSEFSAVKSDIKEVKDAIKLPVGKDVKSVNSGFETAKSDDNTSAFFSKKK